MVSLPIYWMSAVAFPIVTIVIFFIVKYRYKMKFNMEKVMEIGLISSVFSYIAFTLLSVYVPVMLARGIEDVLVFHIIGEFMGFVLASIILIVIVFCIISYIFKAISKVDKSDEAK